MALTVLTSSLQSAAINYSYTTSGSADWENVPTSSYFYDIVDKTIRFKAANNTYSNIATSSLAVFSLSSNIANTALEANGITTAITNNIDNYLLTATGTGIIEGEGSLTFDGATLTLGGSFAQGDGSSIANGDYSHAEGDSTQTPGMYSHTEGANTITFGKSSHAEGYNNQTGIDQGYLVTLIVAGTCSLDESYGDLSTEYSPGDTILLDDTEYDNIYGVQTFIIAGVNIIEGITYINLTDISINTTTAIIGNLTTGIENWNGGYMIGGGYSHVEGIGTVTLGVGQHISGRYNTVGDITSLFIVGNGNGGDKDIIRSDAFKVTPSGSIILPSIVSSTAPSWIGTPGEMIFGDDGEGEYKIFVWLDGGWRTSTLT